MVLSTNPSKKKNPAARASTASMISTAAPSPQHITIAPAAALQDYT